MHQSSYTKVINGKEIGITRRIFLRKSMTGFEPSPLKTTRKKNLDQRGIEPGTFGLLKGDATTVLRGHSYSFGLFLGRSYSSTKHF